MIFFVAVLNLFMNFCYGSMIVVLPQLNLESAGFAYAAFFLVKAAWYFVSGKTDDRLGPGLSVSLSLILQGLALVAIFHFPQIPWLGRILEGIALAQGTVSSLSILRLVAPSLDKFSKAMGQVLGLGSLGFVVGPVTAFFIKDHMLTGFGLSLYLISFVLAVVWSLAWSKAGLKSNAKAADAAPASVWTAAMLWPILAVACIKSIVMGLQLNLGWWARETVGLGSFAAGASFIVLSLLFAVGAFAHRFVPALLIALVGPLGYIFLELSLGSQVFWWWTSLVLIGFWYGCSISIFYARLGWNNASGATPNATWLFLTDAPMAILPALVWPTRQEIFSTERLWLVGILLALSLLGYWRTFAWGSRAPKQNSQSSLRP